MEEERHRGSAKRFGGVVISEQQRARISQNYRAAKALLDRKRSKTSPYAPTTPTIHQTLPKSKKRVADSGAGFPCGPLESRWQSSMSDKLSEEARIPFQEIVANTCKPKLASPGFSLLSDHEGSWPRAWFISCTRSRVMASLEKISNCEEVSRPVPTNDSPPSCVSSKEILEDCDNDTTPLNASIEEFDDSFLQEIDTILERKYLGGPEIGSAVKGGYIGQSKDTFTPTFELHNVSNRGCIGMSDFSVETDLLVQKTNPYTSVKLLPEKNTELVASAWNSECLKEHVPALVKEEPEILACELGKNCIGQPASSINTVNSVAVSACEQIVGSKCALSDICVEEPCSMSSHNRLTDDSFSKYFHTLNNMQREAATGDITVPLMIVAGPGSGKTATIVGRVLMLLREGIAPSNILAMTFTTAATSEMRERIGTLAGKAVAKELTICTFHSFCLQLCRSHSEKLQRTPDFSIYGTGQQRRAVIEAVRLTEMCKRAQNNCVEQNLGENSTDKRFSAVSFKDNSKKWQKFVAVAKASGRTAEDYLKMGCELGAKILEHYNDILKSCNALDYYDFISLSLKLLTHFPEVHEQCQDLWKAIVVDEFQDTSTLQYCLLRVLASHNHVTVVGDEDQSIFSFNGADVSGFDSFRKDFPGHKEVKLQKNYRSTRSIVEASLSLIQNNRGRCQLKQVLTDNDPGSKISVVECHNEDSQCSYVIDKITELTSDRSAENCHFGNIAILYRRQVSGQLFQTSFRTRKIPFNVHGVAFYRKKVIKAIMAILKTALPGCEDGPYCQVFKALFPGEKAEKKRVVDYIGKVSATRKCSFFSTASNVFTAKVSGTFTRSQLSHGRKVLLGLDMISKLVRREQSLSVVINSVANLLPQKYLLDQRAVIDSDGRKLLNEDSDLRSVIQYLLDDVSEFLSKHAVGLKDGSAGDQGCICVLKGFVDYISEREAENFLSRRVDNMNSVSLTTIHQSKGLEWDTVFIIKVNDSEIPLLHDTNGFNDDSGNVEEERRLLYVAMTRARKKLYILYAIMDANWQVLQPSRFLKELPPHLLEIQDGSLLKELQTPKPKGHTTTPECNSHILEIVRKDPDSSDPKKSLLVDCMEVFPHNLDTEVSKNGNEEMDAGFGSSFLRRFNIEDRSSVSHLFHSWAKKQAFHDPGRLLDKVGFIVDERLRNKKIKNKNLLQALRSSLKCDEAFHFAQYVLRWEEIPADKRAQIMHEKQECFQKLRIESSMNSSAATSKQVSFLQKLGCTITPTSRLHASKLIERYKSL